MSDLDRVLFRYPIFKRDWDEMNDLAWQYGYADDEIQELHEAAGMSSEHGAQHKRHFQLLVVLGRPRSTRTLNLNSFRRPTMWDNITWRIGMWWHHILNRTPRRRNYRGLGKERQDD